MLRNFDLTEMILRIPAMLICLTVHEYAHGYAADKMGDPTARNLGRLSLNPLVHLDLIGSLMILFAKFGWAKPVPINPRNFNNFKKGTIITSIAGPLSNLITAFITCLIIGIIPWGKLGIIEALRYYTILNLGKENIQYFVANANIVVIVIHDILITIFSINVSLAIFNMIPIPPLDGSKVLVCLLPGKYANFILQYERYGMIILILLLYTNILTPLLSNMINFVASGMISIINFIPFMSAYEL